MSMYQRLPRFELEDLISELSFSYPKCFSQDPFQKRPLKKNIILDIQKDTMRDDDKLDNALSFYMRDWNYEHKLQAGAKRIDLDGKEVGTVTETEAREARERVRLAREERAASQREEKNFTVHTLSPQPKPTPPPPSPPTTTTTTIPETPMARLYKLVENIERVSSTDDAGLRDALIVAALQVLITEATRLVESLQ
jgi:sRNA-binding protein